MKSVWILHHVHEFKAGHEDVKLIGVFETAEGADAARVRVSNQPGFKDYPEGFFIDKHMLGMLGWVEGYVTLSDNA
jgi:hypothetical protein